LIARPCSHRASTSPAAPTPGAGRISSPPGCWWARRPTSSTPPGSTVKVCPPYPPWRLRTRRLYPFAPPPSRAALRHSGSDCASYHVWASFASSGSLPGWDPPMAYVRYPHADASRRAAVERPRAAPTSGGEDLGTVGETVRCEIGCSADLLLPVWLLFEPTRPRATRYLALSPSHPRPATVVGDVDKLLPRGRSARRPWIRTWCRPPPSASASSKLTVCPSTSTRRHGSSFAPRPPRLLPTPPPLLRYGFALHPLQPSSVFTERPNCPPPPTPGPTGRCRFPRRWKAEPSTTRAPAGSRAAQPPPLPGRTGQW